MNHSWCEKKMVVLANVSILVFYLSLLTRDLFFRKENRKAAGLSLRPPKINQRTTPLAKRTLTPNMFLPEPLPGLPQCLPALAHLLLVIGVQGHLFCDLW